MSDGPININGLPAFNDPNERAQINPFGPDPERRQRIVDATLAEFKKKHAHPKAHELVSRANVICEHVMGIVNEVLRAAEAGNFHPDSCFSLVQSLMQEAFSKWDRDELLFIVTLIHTELTMDVVREKVRTGMIGPDMNKPV